jgi:hypothetical protein
MHAWGKSVGGFAGGRRGGSDVEKLDWIGLDWIGFDSIRFVLRGMVEVWRYGGGGSRTPPWSSIGLGSHTTPTTITTHHADVVQERGQLPKLDRLQPFPEPLIPHCQHRQVALGPVGQELGDPLGVVPALAQLDDGAILCVFFVFVLFCWWWWVW